MVLYALTLHRSGYDQDIGDEYNGWRQLIGNDKNYSEHAGTDLSKL